MVIAVCDDDVRVLRQMADILNACAGRMPLRYRLFDNAEELLRLAEAVLSGEVKYCTHGRPVAVTLTRRELDKLFKRIV